MTIYHGTSKEAANIILANGFKPFECSDFGKAVYFSGSIETAKDYAHKDGNIIQVVFSGCLLDLSKPDHFEIYKKTGNAIPKKYDALKDGDTIAVYNIRSISINKLL
jgi:hypothetical protein